MSKDDSIIRSWYLIHSKPNQETTAKENLERQGYETYLPLIPTRRKKRGKSIKVIAPMFPRYLFIYLSNKTDNWGPIRSTLGVSTLVRFGMEPAKVPDDFVKLLKDRETDEGFHPVEKKEYIEGEKVFIAEGPFEGYEAVFSYKEANDRVVVLLKIAENYVKLKLERAAIEQEI